MYLPKLVKKAVACSIGIIFSLSFIFFLYSQTLIVQMRDHSQRVINDLSDGAEQAYATLAMLNQQNYTQCSSSNLLTMRKLQFEANDIKDIGYFEGDNIICTTGVGKLDKPIPAGKSDHTRDGHEFWFGHKLRTFDGTIEGVVIKSGRYNVVLSFSNILLEHRLFSNYEVVALLGDKTKHLFGNKNIYLNKTRNTNQYTAVSLSSHRVESCGETGLICVAIKQINFSEYQKTSFVLILMLIIILSGMSSLYVYRYLDKYLHSTKRRIKHGLDNSNFNAYYQPIVDLNTGKTIGCEMLARFKDPAGELSPDTFIPMIAELDKSWEFTELLIKQALRDLTEIGDAYNPIYLSVNIFPKDINNSNVLNILNWMQSIPDNIEIGFEITEDEELDFSIASDVLNKLIVAGITISIDDFGTGYSNMSQLKTLPINTLKIDKSFIDQVESRSIRSTLIPNIVSIAHKLHAQIIAEGVENRLQVDELLKMDITLAQGWHYSKALPIEQFKQYLVENSRF